MDVNHPHNQGYWFVLREDQSNVIFSSNNFTIQNPQIAGQEARYIVDASTSENRQFIQINDAPVIAQETTIDTCENEPPKTKDDENFWDRTKIKLLLTLCLENRFRNASKDKALWNEISTHLETTSEECSKKYRNLRRTYIRLLKKKRLGKEIKWVHFNSCEEVFKDCNLLPNSVLEPWEDQKVIRLLSLYIENLNKFRNPEGLQKDIWKEIANQVGTTEYNCYHKFKNLKRTYFNWVERSRETGKVIKWPYHHYFERIFYNYNPSAGPWDREKTKQLLDAYTQIAHKFKNPRFQKKELWKEISETVGESPSSCDKKFRNMKQTYIRLKIKAESGRSTTKWRYYKDFEAIYGPTRYTSSLSADGRQKITCYKSHEEDYVQQLLTYYLENKDKFRDPLTRKKDVWRYFAPKIGISSEECDKKFRNLKQTYVRLVDKKRESGKSNSWPYYSIFEKIYDDRDPTVSTSGCATAVDNMTVSEIKRVMHEMQDRKDDDKFEKLIKVVEESNKIQRERNLILQALLNRNMFPYSSPKIESSI